MKPTGWTTRMGYGTPSCASQVGWRDKHYPLATCRRKREMFDSRPIIDSAPASAFLILKSFKIIPLQLGCRVPTRVLACLLSDGPGDRG
jgi:hypothetical protein